MKSLFSKSYKQFSRLFKNFRLKKSSLLKRIQFSYLTLLDKKTEKQKISSKNIGKTIPQKERPPKIDIQQKINIQNESSKIIDSNGPDINS